jgi:hypothetical protein
MAKKEFIKATTQVMGKASEQKRNSEEHIIANLIILKDLEDLIPPLSADEYEQLRLNIEAEGCREPLIVWQNGEEFILIDGHNRHKICQQAGKTFKIVLMEFEDIDKAKDWMINNQLGKRNVSDSTKSYLRGVQYNREKNKLIGGMKLLAEKNETHEATTQKTSQRTNERLAEQHRVSAKTIERDEKFALGLDKLTENDKQLKSKILNKEIQINKSVIEGLANKSEIEVQKIRESLQTGNIEVLLEEAKKQTNEDAPYKNILKKLSHAIQSKSKDEAKKWLKSLSETIDNL